MHTPAKARGTTQQINIRWESGDVETIRRIAEKEERTSSEIVRWFVRWGAKHFNHAGSLAALEMTSLDYAQKLIAALVDAQRNIEQQMDIMVRNAERNNNKLRQEGRRKTANRSNSNEKEGGTRQT